MLSVHIGKTQEDVVFGIVKNVVVRALLVTNLHRQICKENLSARNICTPVQLAAGSDSEGTIGDSKKKKQEQKPLT